MLTTDTFVLKQSDDDRIKAKLKRLLDLNQTIPLEDARLDSGKRSALVDVIGDRLLATALGLDDVPSGIKGASSDLEMLTTALAVSLVIGYWQGFYNDIPTDKSGSSNFGFEGLEDCLDASITYVLGEIIPEDRSRQMLGIGLRVSMRDCDGAEYFESGLWREDIDLLISRLSFNVDEGYNVDVLTAVKNDGSLKTTLDGYVADIKKLYDLLFEDAYGIDTYAGILADGNKFITLDRDSLVPRVVTDGSASLTVMIRDKVMTQIGRYIKISMSRQFNYDEIFAEQSKTVYFPMKILEYAFCRKTSSNRTSDDYEPYADKAVSWADYSKTYVHPNIQSILERGAYRALEKILGVSFTSLSFISEYGASYPEFITKSLETGSNLVLVRDLIKKVALSLLSAYILTKYPYIDNKIAGMCFRVCMEHDFGNLTCSSNATKFLYSGLVTINPNEEFKQPVEITSESKNERNVKVSMNIYEYQYDADPALVGAEPLFGYKVQRINQIKGVSAGWTNILIGQSISGKEVYASAKSDIRLRPHFIHNIYAGSRAGKGVMTMNLLVNALAAGKPVFYLDRKPDMASMFYALSDGRQFLVNGGDYKPNNEFPGTKSYNENTGEAMEVWRKIGKPYLEAHPEVADLFGAKGNVKYINTVGDYVYLRAFLFCFSLILLRVNLGSNDPFTKEWLNGSGGLVLVVDELSNVQQGIGPLFGPAGIFAIAANTCGSTDVIKQKKKQLMQNLKAAEATLNSAKNEAAQIKAQLQVEKAQDALESFRNEKGAYAATILNKISKIFAEAKGQKNAGFKGGEKEASDVFVLGQNLFYNPLDTGSVPITSLIYKLNKDGTIFGGAATGDIIRGILDAVGFEDWFLGGNTEDKYAEGLTAGDKEVVDWVEENVNWSYFRGSESISYDEVVHPSKEGFSGTKVLFKPYLVLNLHDEGEPPDDVETHTGTRYTYIAQCANRVNDKVSGLWESVRLKHLINRNDPSRNTLDPGIGFEGLIRDTLKTTEEGRNMSEDALQSFVKDALSKSGDIANEVARRMGYSCWQELIFDFSPAGFFSHEDIATAVTLNDPAEYRRRLPDRVPIFAELGLLEGFEPSDDDSPNVFGENVSSRFDFGEEDLDDSAGTGGSFTPTSGTPTGSGTPVTPSPTGEMPAGTSAQDAANVLWGSFPSDEPEDEGEDPEDDPFGDWGDDDSPASAPAPAQSASPMMSVGEVQNYVSLAIELVIEFLGDEYGNYTAAERKEFMTRAFDILSAS